jgi:hypothetical protein
VKFRRSLQWSFRWRLRWGLQDREGGHVKAKREPLRNDSDGRVLGAGRARFAYDKGARLGSGSSRRG